MSSLTIEARKECLYLARRTLHNFLRKQKDAPPYEPVQPELKEKRGAFVTLKALDELRGCIGYLEAIQPLWETIQECAISAASRDPRFPPVTPAELPGIGIEISVLSPLREIQDTGEIEVGRHGIFITRGFNRGVLLPQVATEYGWDREQFLAHTCRKAGLPMDAWHKRCKIEIFSADVFSEADFGQ